MCLWWSHNFICTAVTPLAFTKLVCHSLMGNITGAQRKVFFKNNKVGNLFSPILNREVSVQVQPQHSDPGRYLIYCSGTLQQDGWFAWTLSAVFGWHSLSGAKKEISMCINIVLQMQACSLKTKKTNNLISLSFLGCFPCICNFKSHRAELPNLKNVLHSFSIATSAKLGNLCETDFLKDWLRPVLQRLDPTIPMIQASSVLGPSLSNWFITQVFS